MEERYYFESKNILFIVLFVLIRSLSRGNLHLQSPTITTSLLRRSRFVEKLFSNLELSYRNLIIYVRKVSFREIKLSCCEQCTSSSFLRVFFYFFVISCINYFHFVATFRAKQNLLFTKNLKILFKFSKIFIFLKLK